MKVRKKPVVVDAWKLNGDDIEIIEVPPLWVVEAGYAGFLKRHIGGLWEISTLEGSVCAHDGDYIIKGVHGELYPIQKEIFEETFEVLRE